jgi:hypothetical protein
VRRLGLQARAQAIDVGSGRTDLAQQFDLTRVDRVGDRDRVLVKIQSNLHRAIVFHAGLRAGNSRVWPCPHRAALAEMLTGSVAVRSAGQAMAILCGELTEDGRIAIDPSASL